MEIQKDTSAKKTAIVHVLRVLYNYTSKEFPATQTAIVNYLNDLGISCSRKTVGRNLAYLSACGAPIRRLACKNGGYYYDHKNDRFLERKRIVKNGEERK